MVNRSFQKSEAAGWFKTVVADRRSALCQNTEGESCSAYRMPLAPGYMEAMRNLRLEIARFLIVGEVQSPTENIRQVLQLFLAI